MAIQFNIKSSLFADYSTVIFDLDGTLWQCYNPMGDGIGAYKMTPPFELLDPNTIQDTQHNICRLQQGVKEMLSSLDDFGINLGIVSRSAEKDLPDEAQPAAMLLKKFDIYKFFNYSVTIKPDIDKGSYVRPNGKTLFIDDMNDRLQQVNERGLVDVLDRKKFKHWQDLFPEQKEEKDNTNLKTVKNMFQTSGLKPRQYLIKVADPLTYTDKSDSDETNARERAEVFHQDDHFDINNGRDHIWMDVEEPVKNIYLDTNIVPCTDDKLKQYDPSKGGIANSSLRFAEVDEIGDYSYYDDYMYDHPESTLSYDQFEEQIEARAKQELEQHSEEVSHWALEKFDGDTFSIDRLPKMFKYNKFCSSLTGQVLNNFINDLITKYPRIFKLNNGNVTIGEPRLQAPRLNTDELKQIALAPIQSFETYGQAVDTKDGKYVYIDNGSDILAVAHLDTVQDYDHFDVNEQSGGDRVIKNAQLDDRLGAYVILKLLPQMGINVDVLLTEGEETGRSTARYFVPSKQYKWMFSFDRAGMDTVMYQYHDENTEKLLNDEKFTVGKGSFSDIAFLEHLGIKGFNFGVGYYDNHNEHSHAVESEVLHNVKLFADFYNKYKDRTLAHQDTGYMKRRFGSLVFSKLQCQHCGDTRNAKSVGKNDRGKEVVLCSRCNTPTNKKRYNVQLGEFKTKGSILFSDILEHMPEPDDFSLDSAEKHFMTLPTGSGHVLLRCTNCGHYSILKCEDINDYDFWSSATHSGYCENCGTEDCEEAMGLTGWDDQMLGLDRRNRTASFDTLPHGEEYSDYVNIDISPKDPKSQDELEDANSSTRKDLEKQYYGLNLHDTPMRPETDRPLTPYASLKYNDILPELVEVRRKYHFLKCVPLKYCTEGILARHENDVTPELLNNILDVTGLVFRKPYLPYVDFFVGLVNDIAHKYSRTDLTSGGFQTAVQEYIDVYPEFVEKLGIHTLHKMVNDFIQCSDHDLAQYVRNKNNRGMISFNSLKFGDILEHMEEPEEYPWKIGDHVDVYPLPGDDFNEFAGTIVRLPTKDRPFYGVRDSDDNWWDAEDQQILETTSALKFSHVPTLDVHEHVPNGIIAHTGVYDALQFNFDNIHRYVTRHETQDDHIYKSASTSFNFTSSNDALAKGRYFTLDEALEALNMWYTNSKKLKDRSVPINERMQYQTSYWLREAVESRLGYAYMTSVGGATDEDKYNTLKTQIDNIKNGVTADPLRKAV